MRFDVVTIFPEYFEPLKLSLLGKAQEDGNLEVRVHNLRDWATGKHLSVDAPPAGGGAGMVMRPDVWGEALDATLNQEVDGGLGSGTARVVAIPTPSGKPLRQSDLERLAGADQIVVACGRYEGIDARVAQHYRGVEGVEVLEFSLGDYVLNGGEVAALALIEGVARLLDGVVGNPDSLVEESHSEAGLLEYPVFTHPRTWRELATPPVLSSGNHALVERWRRDQALKRTALARPDMIWSLACRPRDERGRPEGLDSKDLRVLASVGFLLVPRPAKVVFESWGSGDAAVGDKYAEVARNAAQTFPLACPPGTDPGEIQEFISENLTAEALRHNVEVEGARICVARVTEPVPPWEPVDSQQDPSGNETASAPVVAYTLMFPTVPEELSEGLTDPVYLSKCYTEQSMHGSGVSGALVDFALKDARDAWGERPVVLGTNVGNKRATRFYRNHGFRRAGTRTFRVGQTLHKDNVFVLDLTGNGAPKTV